MFKVEIRKMKESHRDTFWVYLINPTGGTLTPYMSEHRDRAVFTACEYAMFLGDMDAFNDLLVELKQIDPAMATLLSLRIEK